MAEPPARKRTRDFFCMALGFDFQKQATLLAADCSNRRYYRIHGWSHPAVLMDAPPPEENASIFVEKSTLLRHLGFRAPEIYAQDLENGFLLLEDFGDDTFGRLIQKQHDPLPLLKEAVDVLVALHQRYQTQHPTLPPYSALLLQQEANLFTEWYLPTAGILLCPTQAESFKQIWKQLLTPLLPCASSSLHSFVLRDYHVDNLMWCPHDTRPVCGLLDFQDGVYGPKAYDLVSLLEDARWDVPATWAKSLKDYYLQQQPAGFDAVSFQRHYTLLGAQRAMKILGIFTRLAHRDNRPLMLVHLPRVWRHLENSLQDPCLSPLKFWLEKNFYDAKKHYDLGCRPGPADAPPHTDTA